MPNPDQITKILEAHLESGASPVIVLTVRHSASHEAWIVPMSIEAAADMVKRVSACRSKACCDARSAAWLPPTAIPEAVTASLYLPWAGARAAPGSPRWTGLAVYAGGNAAPCAHYP
jgi:hypothetical protein